MPAHDHSHTQHGAEPESSFWTSRAFLVCAAFLVAVLILLWTEHLAHALGYLPYFLILACPLMHIFMHGGHGGHKHSAPDSRDRDPTSGGRP
ncbi:MAG: DUF2933 domain-containing protein [Hyphomicrobiaceae bacterium]